MTDLSKKSCVVLDHGLFVEVAHRLARDFGRVYYVDPSHEEAFAKIDHAVIGDGFTDIDRVEEIWDVIDKVDLCVFPDVFHGKMQEHIQSMGIPVWGGRRACELEVKKVLFRALQRQNGMLTPDYQVIIGLDDLVKFCRNPENDDCWIKLSPQFRGNRETFHHSDYLSSRPILNQMGVDFGIVQDTLKFLAEKSIDADFEGGMDTYCVDGDHPSIVLQAYERKDRCCIGVAQPYVEAPQDLTDIGEKLWPMLKAYGARQFVSSEVKIAKDGKAYLLEPTVRMASPAGEPQLELYKNFSEIVYEGARGELIDPDLEAAYYFQCMIQHTGESNVWRDLSVPQHLRRWVKLYCSCRVRDRIGVAPGDETIGSIIGIGDTPGEALEHVQQIADELKDQPLRIQIEDFSDTISQIREAKKEGIPFGKKTMIRPEEALPEA